MFRFARTIGYALTLALAAPAVGTPPASADGHAPLRQVLGRLTTVDGAPGALVSVRDRHGSTVLTSGVADLRTGAPIPAGARWRIGSVTKTFVAAVVLQLAAEHRVALDAPVARYLPGVVRGNGNDGNRITVRELLQHTSGLPDVLTYLTPRQILADRYAHHDTIDLVRIALAHPPLFPPGTRWSYSNTDYLVAGLLVEKVTGHPYGQEVRHRILAPLGLHATSVPGDRVRIPGPHPRGYVRPGEDAAPLDVTELNPTVAGPSGEIISSAADLATFFEALVGGRLLPPAELREMMTTRATGGSDGRAYGLGLEREDLPCGGVYWGHGGDMLGFETATGVTTDGREATVMVNLDPGGSDAQEDDIQTALRTALCGARAALAQ